MARFYVDHDVAGDVTALLRAARHDVVTVRELTGGRGKDPEHFLAGARTDRILITHNARDFLLLHDAWIRWSRAWSVNPVHSGVLVLRHGRPRRLFDAITEFLQTGQATSNEAYEWNPTTGWKRVS